MTNFEDKNIFLEELVRNFPIKRDGEISFGMLEMYEGEVVYDYFYEKTWLELISGLDFRLDGEALEKGCLYLNKDDFIYYFPLYIYASVINVDGWAFEYSFFMNYLIPDVMGEEEYFAFIDRFSELQNILIYDFVLYKSEKGDVVASEAFNKFWCLYS
ncbi:hypothetical protein [Citrobacter rodentium]|nr:hypothetical protein [Citrobacter rodentium]KIQ50797.1 hypothetical protein TA05_13855 [Citrobacter rodentium]QBY30397.1 hypothetical protein E2R62_17175 [Citrobacter rodentium]UHO32233.1 hypothetical protein K7R23_05970 [Citrobacter rodentium NBRC 105723 = DSM 16636]HAT8012589.1 hypothetical protein [Citrobacter rodentium NBRC 105723 = DSM 16636]HAT8017889.1 hypothetical protein [Citrobacter rodentium]